MQAQSRLSQVLGVRPPEATVRVLAWVGSSAEGSSGGGPTSRLCAWWADFMFLPLRRPGSLLLQRPSGPADPLEAGAALSCSAARHLGRVLLSSGRPWARWQCRGRVLCRWGPEGPCHVGQAPGHSALGTGE